VARSTAEQGLAHHSRHAQHGDDADGHKSGSRRLRSSKKRSRLKKRKNSERGSGENSKKNKLPEMKTHGVSEDQLGGSCAALKLLARLYAQHEAPLKALLQEMGAAGAVMASEEQVGGGVVGGGGHALW
jgi:hypothetical protein